MIFKTRVGVTFYIMLIFIIAVLLFLVSMMLISDLLWVKILSGSICVLLAAVVQFHIFPMIKNTFYRFDDDSLFIKTGRFNVEILYTDIVSFTCGVKSMLMQPTLTFNNRLEIKYKTKGGMTDIVHISPVNEDAFVNILKSRVQKIRESEKEE